MDRLPLQMRNSPIAGRFVAGFRLRLVHAQERMALVIRWDYRAVSTIGLGSRTAHILRD